MCRVGVPTTGWDVEGHYVEWLVFALTSPSSIAPLVQRAVGRCFLVGIRTKKRFPPSGVTTKPHDPFAHASGPT